MDHPSSLTHREKTTTIAKSMAWHETPLSLLVVSSSFLVISSGGPLSEGGGFSLTSQHRRRREQHATSRGGLSKNDISGVGQV